MPLFAMERFAYQLRTTGAEFLQMYCPTLEGLSSKLTIIQHWRVKVLGLGLLLLRPLLVSTQVLFQLRARRMLEQRSRWNSLYRNACTPQLNRTGAGMSCRRETVSSTSDSKSLIGFDKILHAQPFGIARGSLDLWVDTNARPRFFGFAA